MRFGQLFRVRAIPGPMDIGIGRVQDTCGFPEHGAGRLMRARIGLILITITMTAVGNTMRVIGIMTTTATTMIGTTTAIENLPGTAGRGRETVPPWRI
jgi:hypothetical protein